VKNIQDNMDKQRHWTVQIQL